MPASHAVNSDTFKVTTPSPREIVLTRLFNAPPQLLFDAMTQAQHITQWWGALSDKHSMPVCEMDARVGGRYRFVGANAEGQIPAFYGVIRELDPPHRIVYTETFEPFPDAESVVTSVLSEEGGKTRLTVTAVYPSQEVRDMVLQTGMEHGAGLSYDRLDEVAAALDKQ